MVNSWRSSNRMRVVQPTKSGPVSTMRLPSCSFRKRTRWPIGRGLPFLGLLRVYRSGGCACIKGVSWSVTESTSIAKACSGNYVWVVPLQVCGAGVLVSSGTPSAKLTEEVVEASSAGSTGVGGDTGVSGVVG